MRLTGGSSIQERFEDICGAKSNRSGIPINDMENVSAEVTDDIYMLGLESCLKYAVIFSLDTATTLLCLHSPILLMLAVQV